MDQALALQLHFLSLPDVRALGCGLVGASPERPGDDVCGLDASLCEPDGDTSDFLYRPADQWRRVTVGLCIVFWGDGTVAALAFA